MWVYLGGDHHSPYCSGDSRGISPAPKCPLFILSMFLPDELGLFEMT